MFFPLWGLTPVSHMFLSLWPSQSHSHIPSLAPSWWSPCPILRRASMAISCCVLRVPSAFVCISLVLSIPFALSPLSLCVLDCSIHPFREVSLPAGASHPVVGSIGAHRTRGGSTYITLHRTWSVSAVLASATWGSGSVLSYFYMRDIPHAFNGNRFLCFFVLCMSQPKMSLGVVLFGHMLCHAE